MHTVIYCAYIAVTARITPTTMNLCWWSRRRCRILWYKGVTTWNCLRHVSQGCWLVLTAQLEGFSADCFAHFAGWSPPTPPLSWPRRCPRPAATRRPVVTKLSTPPANARSPQTALGRVPHLSWSEARSWLAGRHHHAGRGRSWRLQCPTADRCC